ncbi:MAG TPA: polysaccharide deacetylase family protein [Spirochaetota bacterium]|nr:polysaccharide deacetylase family protein [Spirochaetota bacterium]
MYRRPGFTAAHATLLAFVGIAVFAGWAGLTGKTSLESMVQPIKRRCYAAVVVYRGRIVQYHAHIAKKIKTRSYGRAMLDGDTPALPDSHGADEAMPGLAAAPVVLTYAPGTEKPPPESLLVKGRPPVAPDAPSRPARLAPELRRKPLRQILRPPLVPGPQLGRVMELPPVAPRVWKHGPRERPRVALSFDSGEINAGHEGCSRLIDHLVASKTPATFFLTGRFAEGFPEMVRKIGSVRHFELGNHSHTHPDLTGKSSESVTEEILRAQSAIHRLTGRQGRLFRPPYGKVDPVVREAAARNGFHTVLWDVAADDYRNDVTPEQVTRAVLGGVRNGSIILLHMHGNKTASCVAVPAIISGLRNRGFELVMVSSLIGDTVVE